MGSARVALASRAVVVRRGGGVQLRVNGTLASFQGSGRDATGPVWWALAAPIVVLPPRARPPRVLVLGLGGGSVARAMRILCPAAGIVGVERDRTILKLARRHFGLRGLGVEVVVDDVFRYLREERRTFDLIVEDVFVGPLRTVHKPVGLLDVAYPLIARRLRSGGLVVSNTIHESPAVVRAMRPFSPRVLSLDVDRHWNRIVVGGASVPAPRDMRRLLSRRASLLGMLRKVSIRRR